MNAAHSWFAVGRLVRVVGDKRLFRLEGTVSIRREGCWVVWVEVVGAEQRNRWQAWDVRPVVRWVVLRKGAFEVQVGGRWLQVG